MNTSLTGLLGLYMTEKHMDEITLARKRNNSPMNIVNIKKGSHTYSQRIPSIPQCLSKLTPKC